MKKYIAYFISSILLLTGMFNNTSVVLSVNAAEDVAVSEVRISGFCSNGETGYGFKIRFGEITTTSRIRQSCAYMSEGGNAVDVDEKIRFAYVDNFGNLYLPGETGDFENDFFEYFTSSTGINCNNLPKLEDTACFNAYYTLGTGDIEYYE